MERRRWKGEDKIGERENATVDLQRIWAMPNKNTFDIKPIGELIKQERDEALLWIDPFANKNRMATITNDLNQYTIQTITWMQSNFYSNLRMSL